jgi:hypothetical protein
MWRKESEAAEIRYKWMQRDKGIIEREESSECVDVKRTHSDCVIAM